MYFDKISDNKGILNTNRNLTNSGLLICKDVVFKTIFNINMRIVHFTFYLMSSEFY